MKINHTYFGDCLEVMPSEFPDNCFDAIICDLPYGTTRNKWDVVIPFEPLWDEIDRITKKNSPIILFGQGIFSAKTILSNEDYYRYSIIWEKTQATGHLNAKKMPLRSHEDINVFYKSLPVYNPQKTTGHPRKVSSAVHKRNSKKTSNYGEYGLTSYDSTERYPRSVWKFAKDTQKSALHATQKPVALIEEIVKTYTNEGMLILDMTCGVRTTGVACENTGRNYVQIEKNLEMFELGKGRCS